MGCGGSKDDKEKEKAESKDDKPTTNPGGGETGGTQAKTDNKPKQAEAPKVPAKENCWLSAELQEMMNDYFTRYDLDGSGTINSNEELKQLCTNLVVKLELDMDVQTIDSYVNKAGDMTKECWEFKAFRDWYIENFKPLPSWMPGDMSSSDEEIPEGDSEGRSVRMRQGTYDLTMTDKYTCPFKLRYSDAKEGTTLFKRLANDDKLGFDTSDRPLGLYAVVGSFDQAGKTCKFTKSYDVDYNPDTKEPVFEFEGTITDHKSITGTWKNTETDASAVKMLEQLGLPEEGEFTMVKRKKDE